MMRTSAFSPMIFVLCLISLSQTLHLQQVKAESAATLTSPPLSYVASSQLEFWYKHVASPMPEAISSKLSPLSNHDSSSLLSSSDDTESSSSSERFCSMAHLACTPFQQHFDTMPQLFTLIVDHAQTSIGHHPTIPADDDQLLTLAGSSVFFRLIPMLQKGKQFKLPSLQFEPNLPRSFLPSQIASEVPPTCSDRLQKVFPDLFASLPTKEIIEESVGHCSNKEGRQWYTGNCSNSIEGTIKFAKKMLGANSGKILAFTSQSARGSGQIVEIENIQPLLNDEYQKVVVCHEIFFPFATYYCHLIPAPIRLYAVDVVEPATKVHVNRVVAICHMDTSEWTSDHVAFKVLKMSPGEGEVCHWLRDSDIAWIANHKTDISSN